MKVVALISGGKDSTYNMMQCVAAGHEIIALANLRPPTETGQDELDSPMFQTVGHWSIEAIAVCMGLPLFTRPLNGQCVDGNLHYRPAPADEVEDMLGLLQDVKDKIDVQAVSVGAILSTYQRVRVESVCNRLGLTCLAYLWQRKQEELLPEMVTAGVKAVLIKVASWGLKPAKHLGKTLGEMQADLLRLNRQCQINVCGEGGEYETFTLDCPLYRKQLVMHSTEIVEDAESDPSAPTAYLKFSVDVQDKQQSQTDQVASSPAVAGESEEDDVIDYNTCALPEPVTPTIEASNPDTYSSGEESSSMSPVSGSGSSLRWIVVDVAAVEDACMEAERALRSLQDRLQDLQARLCNVCQIQLYVRDMANFKAINDVYCRTFNHAPPARACVGLNLPTHLQLACVALTEGDQVPGQGADCPVPARHREHLHVQGLSHWAPANIGPYSQAVQVKPLLWVAGQIGLVPGSMAMVNGGWRTQGPLALRHALRILNVHRLELDHCAMVTVFVTASDAVTCVQQQWTHRCDTSPVMTVVQVSSLPRSAEVEWQVVAVRGDRISHDCSTVTHAQQSYRAEWQVDTYRSDADNITSATNDSDGEEDNDIMTIAMSACLVAEDSGVCLSAGSLSQFVWQSAREKLPSGSSTASGVVQAQLFVDEKCLSSDLKPAMEVAAHRWFVSPLDLLVVPVQRLAVGFMALQLLLKTS